MDWLESGLPVPQHSYTEGDIANDLLLESWVEWLKSLCRLGNLDPQRIHSVADLYCGNGHLSAASLKAFPNAQIHAVDFHDILIPSIKLNPRCTFHRGITAEIIETGEVPPSDLVIISDANTVHGFHRNNIHLLNQITRGLLLTNGDNYGLEQQPWFRDNFRLVAGGDLGELIWRPI